MGDSHEPNCFDRWWEKCDAPRQHWVAASSGVRSSERTGETPGTMPRGPRGPMRGTHRVVVVTIANTLAT